MELIAPCHFGLEAVLRREITDIGYEISEVEDGRITFLGDEEAVCRANIFLRTAERVLIKVGSFHAETFANAGLSVCSSSSCNGASSRYFGTTVSR